MRIHLFRDADKRSVHLPSHTLSSVAAVCADFWELHRRCRAFPERGNRFHPGLALDPFRRKGAQKFIPDSSRLRRLRKGWSASVVMAGVFHVWFHPENLYAEWPRLENVSLVFWKNCGVSSRRDVAA